MIFCYAWTNYLIINMMNAKMNLYPEEKADLIIKSSPAVDMELVNYIKSLNIFEHIYFDDYVAFRPNKKKMSALELRNKYKCHYERFVDSIDTDVSYDKILVAGFWNDTLYMLKALMRKGHRFTIDLIEEGELSYEEAWKLFQPIIGSTRKLRLFHKLNTFFIKHKCKKLLSRKLLLYSPSRQEDPVFQCVQLPKMDGQNETTQLFKGIYEGFPTWKKLYYQNRDYIFFSNYLLPERFEESYRYAHSMIDTIIKVAGIQKMIIKAHTSSTKHRLEFASGYEKKGAYVDRDVYIFEAFFCSPDIENKVLIAKNSSVLIHAVSLFEKEPYVVLLYKLYPWYKNFGDEIADQYVDSLKALYKNPDKIYVPNTMLEFEMQLKEIAFNH